MAFRATQALRMVVKKTSTGLVGLAVDVNARANFIALQQQILEKIKVSLSLRSATYKFKVAVFYPRVVSVMWARRWRREALIDTVLVRILAHSLLLRIIHTYCE